MKNPLHLILRISFLIMCLTFPSSGILGASFGITRASVQSNGHLSVTGTGRARQMVYVFNSADGSALGNAVVSKDGTWRVDAQPSPAPCRIRAESRSAVQEADVQNAPTSCYGTTGGYSHSGRIGVYEGTRTCLGCHRDEALGMHASAHYQWKGSTVDMINPPEPNMGKLGGINDFCIYPDINWLGILTTTNGNQVDGGCARCHTGLGLKPLPDATQEQLENIDCLLCHSPDYKRKVEAYSGVFRLVPDLTNMKVTLQEAAANIQPPSKETCLNCHAFAGGGNNYKRGDLEQAHANPPREMDVHMASKGAGGAGLNCTDCHVSENHRIAGRGSDLRERDLDVALRCTGCHAAAPHSDTRLNTHAKRVDCTVCHIPDFAATAATDMVRDWSSPGDLDPVKGLYEPHMTKALNVVPEYKFFNGKSYFYNFGQTALPQSNGRILMSGPAGDINDPAAKIFAFKHHLARQPIDQQARLLPLKIGIFFQTGNISGAIQKGAEEVGWGYNGHTFADTERYMGIFHEVAPKENAAGCTSCHNGGKRLGFAALGYTPKIVRNGKPLCASCHEDESGEWSASSFFTNVHAKHVTERRLDCSNCHNFTAAQ